MFTKKTLNFGNENVLPFAWRLKSTDCTAAMVQSYQQQQFPVSMLTTVQFSPDIQFQ
jgi:hypothetical protein